MFGWLRKRRRPTDVSDGVQIAEQSDDLAPDAAPEPAPAPPATLVATPALRPSMPLSSRPNVVGMSLAAPELATPRLLEPIAALSPEAREELLALMTDMFGARGRYRLEWRPDRAEGDDAMFSEIMVADLVRRIQNAIAQVAELEQPAPFRAIEAAPTDPSDDEDDRSAPRDEEPDATDEASTTADDVESAPVDAGAPVHEPDTEAGRSDPAAASRAEAIRMAAIDEFFSPAPTLEDIAAALQPDPERLHHDTHEVDGDRRIA